MEEVDKRKLGNKRGRDDEGRGLEKRASGVINVIEEYSYSYSGDEMINGVKYEEEKEAPGLFNQLITNSPNQQEAAAAAAGEDKVVNSSGEDHVVENEKDGNITDNIVARLPRTLSEDTAPVTDEVSILIHSIIHD